MSELAKITTHREDAIARLPCQDKGKPKISALVGIFGSRAQDLEDSGFQIFQAGDIATDEGAALDQTGDVVVQPRGGLADPAYRTAILTKIAENISKSTGEDLISIFKALMQASRIEYHSVFPAGASLTAIGAIPLGSSDEIHAAMLRSCAGGIRLEFVTADLTGAFSFSDDSDPLGQGFGDSNDLAVGGNLASVF